MVPVSNIMRGSITVIFKLFPTTFSNEMTLLRKQFTMVLGKFLLVLLGKVNIYFVLE